MATTYSGTAAALNGQTISSFNPGDQIEITDETPTAANVTISGNQLHYTGGSITIGNLGPGLYVVRSLGSTGTDIRLQQDAHNDFNGDGRSDVLLQNTNGTVTDWLAQSNSSFVGNHLNANPGPDWHMIGTGDFNGDGRVDLLWQNTSGVLTEWLANADGSGTFVGHPLNVNPGPSWHLVGTGDFNRDGHTDLLWQNDSGLVAEWLAQSDGTFAGHPLNLNPGTSWHVVGTGDFNGDGIDDILWQNTDGTVREWLGQSNGSFAGNTANVNVNPGAAWHVVATGDFNGDGLSDVILRNNDGTIREWLADSNYSGGFTGNIANVNVNPGTDWHIVGVGDYNHDSVDDLLLRNNDGTVREWLGDSHGSGSFTGNIANVNFNPGTEWHVQDPFVHDPLG